MNWYLDALGRYAQFYGRSSREAFWIFMVFNLLILVSLIWMEIIFNIPNILDGIYSLLIFFPTFSLIIPRLHDTNRSAWWISIIFLPVMGILVFIYFLAIPSNEGTNRFDLENMRGVL
jgi:uncharacterized membrane protein YhaH (DUF805 family)